MEGRSIDVKGHKLYIEYENTFENKPTIVFLHDSLGCTQLWRDFPAKLGATLACNILVYDRLGYGKSGVMATHERAVNYMELEADLLNELLCTLNVQGAVLFGHSDGGTIALIAASKYPDNIQAVICEAGHIFVEEITIQGVRNALGAYNATNLGERLQKYHGNKVSMLFRAWTEIWLSEKFKSWNIEYLLKDITCPLLFIQGENDEYGTLDQLEKTLAQVSGISEHYIISEIGHTPHKEVPELVLKRSVEFLQQQFNS